MGDECPAQLCAHHAAPYERSEDVRITEEFFAHQGISYFPLEAALKDFPDAEHPYFVQDGHFTEDGYACMARVLADWLAPRIVGQIGKWTEDRRFDPARDLSDTNPLWFGSQ